MVIYYAREENDGSFALYAVSRNTTISAILAGDNYGLTFIKDCPRFSGIVKHFRETFPAGHWQAGETILFRYGNDSGYWNKIPLNAL